MYSCHGKIAKKPIERLLDTQTFWGLEYEMLKVVIRSKYYMYLTYNSIVHKFYSIFSSTLCSYHKHLPRLMVSIHITSFSIIINTKSKYECRA
jgi:hypothetical protein